MAGAGQVEGPLECVWMRGDRGSPGSPSEMSLSLPGPETTCHMAATPLPLEAQIKVIRTGRWLGQIAWTWSEQP